MSKQHPLIARFAAFVMVPLLAVFAYGALELRGSLPQTAGEVRVLGIDEDVSVTRDGNGVVAISATTDADAFFALGYVHAQDRLWQLEVQRRFAAGRLSEVFGKSSLGEDVWLRTLGIYASAEQALDGLSAESLAALEAYAAGINAWLGQGHPLPVEFRALGVQPEPWQPVDSIAWIKVFALDLAGNMRQELRRMAASTSLDEEQLAQLFPGYPVEAPTTVPPVEDAAELASLLEFQDRLQQRWRLGGRFVGSNAWVVSGEHTDDGLPLLAGDPHLGLQIPSPWYMARLDGDRLHVDGATLVGLPVVIFGRNRHIAWAGTNLMADVQDVAVERLTADDKAYWHDGQAEPLQVREELISVKADFPAAFREPINPVRLEVRSTRNGPLVTDALGLSEHTLALRWTGLDPNDTSFQAMLELNYADDWNGFQSALAKLVAPTLNMFYSDREGNIGYQAAGRIPVRAEGDGSFPTAAWSGDDGWVGQIPAEELPSSYNPPQGYLVSGNNKPVGPDYPHFLSYDWAPPSRASRISTLLEAKIDGGEAITAEYMQQMQLDTADPTAKALSELLMTLHTPSDEHEEKAYEYLGAWDGRMAGDSVAAAIYAMWVQALRERLFADELTGSWGRSGERRLLAQLTASVHAAQIRGALEDPSGRWCDLVDTATQESCGTVVGEALKPALWQLYKLKGDRTMESWSWAGVQTRFYQHVPFSAVSALAGMFERRPAADGSGDAVNVSAGFFQGSKGYVSEFGASMRQIIDWQSDGADHWYMNSTGQSGNALSAHYDDMLAPFHAGELHRFPPREGSALYAASAEPAAEDLLVLRHQEWLD